MKKLIFIILCVCMTVTSYAHTSDQLAFVYEDQDVTIMFDENTVFTQDECKYIADLLVYGNTDDGASTYAWCWLTGHDMVSDSVVELKHKVAVSVPRCMQTVYKVESCSKCDHVETTNLGSVMLDCCPED